MELKVLSTTGSVVVSCLLVILTTLGQFEITSGCTCETEHPQNTFCRSDFVIKAKVKHSKLMYSKTKQRYAETVRVREAHTRRYSIRIQRIFKDTEAFRNVTQKRHLYTAANGAMCGIHLMHNTKYLLMEIANKNSKFRNRFLNYLFNDTKPLYIGYILKGRLHISTCNRADMWTQMSIKERKIVSLKYARNCMCKVQTCHWMECGWGKVPKNECIWDLPHDPKKCYANHGFCKQDADGECSWAKTKQLKTCVKLARKSRRLEP